MRTLNPIILKPSQHTQNQQHGRVPRGRRRFMPRYPDMPETFTPFAGVLIDYMWNRRPANRPPMTTHQLAIKLGVPKQSTSNWVMRGVLPPFETVMAVLAKLDIPLRDLYDAYKGAGILMPRWDEQDTDSPASHGALPPTPRTRKATTVPISIEGVNASVASAPDSDKPAEQPTLLRETAPSPLPYTTPAPPPDEATDWDTLVAQTEQALREEGASAAMIEAVIGHIRNQQSGQATPIQRSLMAEHSEPAPSTAPTTPTPQKSHDEPSHDEPPGRLPSDRPAKRGGATKGSLT